MMMQIDHTYYTTVLSQNQLENEVEINSLNKKQTVLIITQTQFCL